MELVIHVSWEYVLGVVGALIAIAYYTNGRLSRIETSIEWIKETLRELAMTVQGRRSKASEEGRKKPNGEETLKLKREY